MNAISGENPPTGLMAALHPITWVPYLPWAGVIWIIIDAILPVLRLAGYSFSLGLIAINVLSGFWQRQVMESVYPYMDEIFHIPQAQAYCMGDFHIWDPKLTTPPGLYIVSTILGNLGGVRSCNVWSLRFLNTVCLTFLMAYAGICRAQIFSSLKRNWELVHTALNIALFPPLFFLSGLYYTDVLSTCVVLLCYRLWLQKKGGMALSVVGTVALSMRQTNIFWVAVFMGGLEAVRTLSDIESIPGENEKDRTCLKGIIASAFHQYERGQIHDVPLKDARIQDFGLCAISIAVAIIFHPIVILMKIWPYISILVSFAAFVVWNGGVVLGDKSNHIATIHLPQLLYLWPFIAFFSGPLLIPSLVRPLIHPSRPSTKQLLITTSYIFTALVLTLAIIHFNTLIHPFTLSDNRHYMFYVFRYTILRHPAIRYLLAPIYVLAFYLCYSTLSGRASTTTLAPRNSKTKPNSSKSTAASLKLSIKGSTMEDPTTAFFLIWVLSTALSLITAPLVEPRYFIIPWVLWRLHVPTLTLTNPTPSGRPKRAGRSKKNALTKIIDFVKYGHDGRLWLETLWFLAINAGTGYVFLYRGFEWAQEPGVVQRFMW